MSTDKLLFEGYLQKRKDTMKIRWVTYWFRLQNTTLFFYTEKNGSAAHLRGYYYIYTVQSVREVERVDRKRFMFEIIMTNGKKKMLAAETATLRKEWVGHIWQAMNLSTSVVSNSRDTHLKVYEQQERYNSSSSTPVCSHSDSVMELPTATPLSVPAPPGCIHHENRSLTTPVCLPEELGGEDASLRNTLPACNYQHHNGLNSHQWSSGLRDLENKQEGDYDVLPLRNKTCQINPSTEMDEGVYDIPLSYRRAFGYQDPTESIYDVPSSLLRQNSDHTIVAEEHLEDVTGAYEIQFEDISGGLEGSSSHLIE